MKENKLMAEFMGLGSLYEAQSSNQWNQYHVSWDALMPVVEKIESLGYEFTIVENRCKVNHNTDHSIKEVYHIEIIGSKIDVTYQTVVGFIKYYTNIMKDTNRLEGLLNY